MSTATSSVSSLRETVVGPVIVPGDAGYDAARSVWNAMIDRRPAVVVRPHGTPDVVAAVGVARDAGLEIAVRGGGHNVAGNAVCDGGLVIDLSEMRAVHVDPIAKRAVVQGGATLADFDRETQQFGLGTTMGAISMTGVAGLTLGGGLGHLMRRYGLACDSLVGAQIVTAGGDVLQVGEQSHADLLWALRGGGGNFGVVTSFEFELHEFGPIVYGGLAAFPASRAPDVLPAYRDWVATTDDALGMNLLFLTAPPLPFVPEEVQLTPIVAVPVCWTGDHARGDELVAPIRGLGPAVDLYGPMPYTVLQSMFDDGFQPGLRSYWKSGYLDELTDDAIATLIDGAAAASSPLTIIECQALGGAVSDGATMSAFGNRDAAFMFNTVSLWEDASDDERHVAWTQDFFRAMDEHGTGGVYVNYLTDDDGDDRVRAAYGAERFRRLADIKATYDPDNTFHFNQNVRPALASA